MPDAIDKATQFAQININNLLVFLSIVLVLAFIGLMFLMWRILKAINRPGDATNTSALITTITQLTVALTEANNQNVVVNKRLADNQDTILQLQKSSQEATQAAQKSTDAFMELARVQQREFTAAMSALNNNIIGVKTFDQRTAALSARIGDVGTSIDELSEKVKMSDETIATLVNELKEIKLDMEKLRVEMAASREVTEETKRKIEVMDAKLQLILDRITTATAPPSEPPTADSPKESL